MILRWFLSKTVRESCEFRKHVIKLMRAQQDLLSPQAISAITASSEDLGSALKTAPKKEIQEKTSALEETATKWLKPYPNAGWRENIEVILVAVVVAMAIRTFYLQPMKIPTGSMQPTLYGITYTNYKIDTKEVIPTGILAWFESCFKGTSYYHFVAKQDGMFHLIDDKPQTLFPFVSRQRFSVGTDVFTVWNPGERFF